MPTYLSLPTAIGQLGRPTILALTATATPWVRADIVDQETATWLNAWGIPADFYHGQRKKSDRERVQDAFMTGDLRVIAATNAFGLGVDKPDVRFVIHWRRARMGALRAV